MKKRTFEGNSFKLHTSCYTIHNLLFQVYALGTTMSRALRPTAPVRNKGQQLVSY